MSGNISADVSYLVQNGKVPGWTMRENGLPAIHHGDHADYKVEISDGRALGLGAWHDLSGFGIQDFRSRVTDFYDDELVRSVYYREVEAHLKEVTGADLAIAFDHGIRNDANEPGQAPPAAHVHVDFSTPAAVRRVRSVVGGKVAEKLLKSRFALYNAWKPIEVPALSSQLALLDPGSIAAGDLVPAAIHYAGRSGEVLETHFNQDHKWVYFSEMSPEEILIFRNYDSGIDGTTSAVPHTAFVPPNVPVDSPRRRSIELRALLFFDVEIP